MLGDSISQQISDETDSLWSDLSQWFTRKRRMP